MAKTLVWSIPDFLNHRQPKNFKPRTIRPEVIQGLITTSALIGSMIVMSDVSFAADSIPTSAAHPISPIFDKKIWPLFLDIGGPLAKTMMAIGIYRCIRNDVDHGWKMAYRAGIGLVGLYTIDGAIHILEGIGRGLEGI